MKAKSQSLRESGLFRHDIVLTRFDAKSQNIWLESPGIITQKTPVTPHYPARK